MNARTTSFALRAALASAALGAAVLLSVPSFADDATTAQSAPAQGAQSAPATGPKMARTNHEDRVGAYLDRLHKELGITSAQESQWNAYAQIMRDNAAAMDQSAEHENQLIEARAQHSTMNAVDDLKAYQALVDAHAERTQAYADGLKKLVPAFETLYTSMSDSQKKTADALFNRARRHHEHKPSNG